MAGKMIVAAAGGMITFRKHHPSDEPMEPDPDEQELRMFEHNCRLLNSKQYTGFRRLQVETWLLFEDQTSSIYAQLVQFGMFILIIFSTALILAQSVGECSWAAGEPDADWLKYDFGTLTTEINPCIDLTSEELALSSCTRVCNYKPEVWEENGPFHYWIMDACCIGAFTVEFVLRMIAAPATIGLRSFFFAVTNWVDVVAIAPFYIDLLLMRIIGLGQAHNIKVLAVLRMIRLLRVVRVLKFSKSISSTIVLARTIYKSIPAMVLIGCVSIISCVTWASAIIVTSESGVFYNESTPVLHIVYNRSGLTWREQPMSEPWGETRRIDASISMFADMMEAWWWCLQTLTSEGYGVPWVPIMEDGKIMSIMAALFGTIILALPIAVVGVTFDDEWVKQSKINKFAGESCVYEYNQITRNGTRAVPDLLRYGGSNNCLSYLLYCCCGRRSINRVAPHSDDPDSVVDGANSSSERMAIHSTKEFRPQIRPVGEAPAGGAGGPKTSALAAVPEGSAPAADGAAKADGDGGTAGEDPAVAAGGA